MTAVQISLAVLLLAARLRIVHRLWRLPLKNGEGFFLAQQVAPDFYRGIGAPLFRRYHTALLIPALADAPLAAWIFLTHRYVALGLEQLLALVVCMVGYNFALAHFSARATHLCSDQDEPRSTTLQLSMAPRRLRDYTIPVLEGVIAGATLLALGLLYRNYTLSRAASATYSTFRAYRGGMLLTVWVLYWQIGFLLIKSVLVRRRMPLPANRTEDFRRWRVAWLSHNIKVYDAVRVFCALSLLAGMFWLTYAREWPHSRQIMLLAAAAVATLVYAVYVVREERRLAAVERELKPVEMAKEFPRWPVAEGRYLAGGLLYFNRDNPLVLVRSAQGIALNLAHRTTYIGVAYFLGLLGIVIWMARLAH